METQTELQALQNVANATNIIGLTIYERLTNDKRRTTKKYFAHISEYGTISPNLDYEQLNHFLHGMNKGIKLTNNLAI